MADPLLLHIGTAWGVQVNTYKQKSGESMWKFLTVSFSTSFVLLGCAAQSPSDQLVRTPNVRVCTGSSCVSQDRNTVTFQSTPTDLQAERRLAVLTQMAEGNPKAAYDLALRLLRGDGVERNSYQALEWMRKAGDHGLPEAQMALGRLYLVGFEEMGADPAEAAAWLSRAAAQGNREAQQLLPQAQAAQQSEQAQYQVRELARKSWGHWYASTSYYWYWSDAGWILR